MIMPDALAEKLRLFFATEQPEARRIFHGRGQCYPGFEHLCLDWFGPVVLISTWQPHDNPGMLKRQILEADISGQVESIVLQHRHFEQSPAETLHGPDPGRVIVRSQGLRFEVNPGRRQNAGLFLDMGPIREWLQANSQGRIVLNLFAYTCALSVAAMAGGAKSVTNLDMSRPSIEWGMRNHLLNSQDTARIHNVPHNLFTSWGKLRQLGRYDLVIIDPPAQQRGSFNSERDYKSTVRRLHKLCNPGATILAALNSPFLDRQFLLEVFSKASPEAKFEGWMPVANEFEESDPDRGLKIALYILPG
jgi:23S rRNA (cytosine1962-C5)-methyltransferase